MSAPRAPQGAAPTWSPPSGSAISSEPDSPSSGGSTTTSSLPSSSPSSITIIASPPPPSTQAPGGGGGAPATTPGCAACKHKRQKCPPGCVLLPYFPASEPDKFRSVLRVFGVKNLLRTLGQVPRPRWDACVRTVVYESRARLADPVRGCVGAIEELEGQLMDTAVELVVLRRRLQSYRQQAKLAQALTLSIQPPNPIHGHGRAAASTHGVVTDPNLGAAPQQQLFPAMQPQLFSPMPTQFSATQQQFPATQPQPQLHAMQQEPAMCRQPTRGASTPIVRDGFGNPWANDDERRNRIV